MSAKKKKKLEELNGKTGHLERSWTNVLFSLVQDPNTSSRLFLHPEVAIWLIFQNLSLALIVCDCGVIVSGQRQLFHCWGKKRLEKLQSLAGGWEVEGILEGNILRRGGGKCRERKDPMDAVNANPAILNQKLRHFLLPRSSPVPASRGPKPHPGKYLQRSDESATGRSSAKRYLRRKNFISVKPTFPCCHSVWKFRTASLPLHTREHTHTHTHTLCCTQCSISQHLENDAFARSPAAPACACTDTHFPSLPRSASSLSTTNGPNPGTSMSTETTLPPLSSTSTWGQSQDTSCTRFPDPRHAN